MATLGVDIVGTAGVDVIPVAPDFHDRLKAIVLPGADRIGDELGRAIGRTLTTRITDAFRQGVTDGGRAAQTSATRQGDQTAGAFARSLRTRLEAAFRALPQLQIGADTSEADSDLQALRVRLETLADRRIGVDISAEDAKAEISELEAELTRLGESHPNLAVRADTATARAALAEVRAEIDAVDGRTARVNVRADTAAANASILEVGANIAALTAIPAVPVLAAGVGGLAASFTAAGAGAGAFALAVVPAVKSVTAAIQAQTAAQSGSKEAVEKYQAALAKLKPESRKLFDSVAGPYGLKKAFNDWAKSLQPTTIPLLIRGVDALKGTLTSLTPLVKAASDGIGVLFDKASTAVKSPFWKTFGRDIDASARPAIVGLGVAFGNVLAGMAGIVDAFLPHMAGIARIMDRLTGRFAAWAKGLKGSPEFEAFLRYVNNVAPKLGTFLDKVLSAALSVSQALSPLSTLMFAVVGPLIDGVSWLATNMPGLVQTFYGIYAVTKLWAVATKGLSVAMGLYATVQELVNLETFTWSAALQTTGIPELILGITIAIAALTAGVVYAYKHWPWFHDAVVAAVTGIKVAVLFLWHDVLKPTFDAIVIGVRALADAAVWLWSNILKPTFDVISTAVRVLVTVWLTLFIAPIVLAVKFVLAPVFTWLWTTVIKPVFGLIGDVVVWLYKNIIKPNFDMMATSLRQFGDAASWLWTHGIKPVFEFIGDKAKWLYENALKPQFNLMMTAVGKVKDAFVTAKDGIKSAWGEIGNDAVSPVRIVVDTVYNEGILPVWNGIAKITGVGKLNPIHPKWPALATGGILPGYTPGRDPHEFYSPTGGRIALSGGEAVMRPEWTRVMGPAYVAAMNSAARSGGVGGVQRAMSRAYADGGIISDLGDFVKSAGSTAKGLFSGIGDVLTNPAKAFDSLSNKIAGLVAHLGTTDFDKMVEKFPTAVVKNLKTKAVDLLSSVVTGGGNNSPLNGVTQWTSVVQKALSFLGQPQGYLGLTLRRMNQESGGNPRAVNLWDSNAKAGHPSVGLLQLIEGTWRRYAGDMINQGPFMYGVSVDPFANVYASMRYALSRYGSLPAAYDRAGGYDEGGWMQPGDWLTYNHTGKPEPVFTADQWSTLKANIGARQGSPNLAADVRVFVGDRELTDIVRTEVTTYDAATARGIDIGRRF